MNTDKKIITEISSQLREAASSVHILRSIAWPKEHSHEFFKNKEQKLPQILISKYDPKPVIEKVKKIRSLLPAEDSISSWANRIADKIENSALLLSNRGTPYFLEHSIALFGKPSDQLHDGTSTALELAHHFDQMFDNVKNIDFGAPPDACVLASTMASEMKKVVDANFGAFAPEIVMDDSLASNALAGRRRISIRPTAHFTENDIQQLIHHEIFVHIVTSLNGYNQPYLKILGEGHAGTTKTQEGLAVFAEFITGSIDLDRIRRLSDRVIAIQMAINGANFIDVYRYYLEKTDNKEQSFENAKRVFRGGMVDGKVPFTKDIVYLDGLINVHNFLRFVVHSGKFEYLDLLFSGKLDIADLPTLKIMSELGMISKPTYLPPWIKDKRYLISYLSYSSFLYSINMDQLKIHYNQMF